MASWASQRRTAEVASVSQMLSVTAWQANSVQLHRDSNQVHFSLTRLSSHTGYSPFDTPIGQHEPNASPTA